MFDVRGDDIARLRDGDRRTLAHQLLPADKGTF